LDEGKVETHVTEFDLKEFISETVEEMKGLLKAGQQFHFEYNGKESIYSDKKLLKNIFINLITNAIKFSDEGSPIKVVTKREDVFAKTSVTDSGIGISEEDQEHLFSSFFRAANAMNIHGSGLGLHIVKRYLDLLGGEVNLQSQLNKGTTINFTIPVNQP
jgi:signal transduction histidine kinase